MDDITTIGRKAGAGMMASHRQEGSPKRAERGSLNDADQTPRKHSLRRTSSMSTDEDAQPPTRRQPLYPSDLSNTTPKQRRQQQRQNRKDEEPVTYQSLDSLLRAAGYADTRIVTPESERIQARVASEKRRREESGITSDDDDEEENEVECLTTVAQQTPRNETTDSTSYRAAEPEPVRVEAGGWWTWMSLGKASGANALQRKEASSDSKPAITRRRSVLDMAPLSKPATRAHASPPHLLNRAFTSPPDSPSPRTRRQPATPVQAAKRVSSLSSTECGSLSSSLSTTASTLISSPPDVPSRSFRPMEGSPVLGQEHTGEEGARQWSPPRGRNVGPVVVRGTDRASDRPTEEQQSDRSVTHRAQRSHDDEKVFAGSKAKDNSEDSRAPRTSGSRPPAVKGKKVAITLEEDGLANSMAARSLRHISSQAALRSAAMSGARLKPKASFSFGSIILGGGPPPDEAQAPPRRTLRHAASTPFFSSTPSASSRAPPPPPLPVNSSQAVKQSWFSTVSRNFFPTTIAQPASTDTAFRRTANPHIRTRPSIPSFHPSTSSSIPTPTTSLSTVSPRTDPLPTQVTEQTVLCSSEAVDDDCGPSFSSFSVSQPAEETSTAAQAAPVLSTKSSFSSTTSSTASAGSEGGDAWKKNLKGGGAGWTWNVSTAMEEDLSFWSTPSPTYPTPEDTSAPAPRPLQAKRSIKSLRAALAASDLSESLLTAPPIPTRTHSAPVQMGPPPPPPEIVISSPGTFEAGIAPRVLDLDEDDLDCFGGRASRRAPLGGRGSGRVIRKKTSQASVYS